MGNGNMEATMSTFKIEGKKLLDGLFPERRWEELKSELYDEIIQTLSGIEQLKSDVADYIKVNRVRIGFHKQYKSGGGWTFLRNITLTPGDDPKNPYVMSLIIHETYHIKQSLWARLSMQGELRAWQYQKQTYPQIAKTKGNEIGSRGEAYSGSKEHWDELSQLSPESREDLKKAQEVMTKISPGYRSGCLPLYPLGEEFKYYWRRKEYLSALGVFWTLITCK
jgi:hypothetical protein